MSFEEGEYPDQRTLMENTGFGLHYLYEKYQILGRITRKKYERFIEIALNIKYSIDLYQITHLNR